jgi:hypothetical protein
MFSLNNFVCDIKDVPSDWIFEHYLELPEPLKGQRVRINSVFNPADKTPSMYIYYYAEGSAYRFKCFSTGNGGSAVDLMRYLWKADFGYTINTIIRDYNNYMKSGKPSVKKISIMSTGLFLIIQQENGIQVMQSFGCSLI